jgi:hypothetical protein
LRAATEQKDARRSFGVTLPSPAAFAACSTTAATLRCCSGRPARVVNTITLAAPPGLQLAAEVVGQRLLDGRGRQSRSDD